MILEVCANSLQSALNAQDAGADRIELCSELGVGGITPSYGLLQQVKEHIRIPVHVLIRPRSGDFSYSGNELEIMKEDIAICREMGFQGVVSGILRKDLSLDESRTRALIEGAAGLDFTFHRAFDWVKHPLQVLENLEVMGVSGILTSGQQRTAMAGLDLLRSMNDRSRRCTVIPGGGINDKNVRNFREAGFRAVHLSATHFHQQLEKSPLVSMYSPTFFRDDAIALSDPGMIRRIAKIVK